MVHVLSVPINNPRQLTQAVLQITEMLDMYRAELARVLHLQCGDIGKLASGHYHLDPDSKAWKQAVLLVRLYAALFDKLQGDGVAMRHWLRVDNNELGGMPLLLIVDDDQLLYVVDYAETHNLQKNTPLKNNVF